MFSTRGFRSLLLASVVAFWGVSFAVADEGHRFYQRDLPASLLKSPDRRARYAKRFGDNAVFCLTANGRVTPKCDAYRREVAERLPHSHGSVALRCATVQAETVYCCNGSIGAGSLPPTAGAPCFTSLTQP